jgi:hypothetical protein
MYQYFQLFCNTASSKTRWHSRGQRFGFTYAPQKIRNSHRALDASFLLTKQQMDYLFVCLFVIFRGRTGGVDRSQFAAEMPFLLMFFQRHSA